MKRCLLLVAVVCAVVLVAGCAPSADASAIQRPDAAGFFTGWWHGFTIMFTFIVSLFNGEVGIYEANNVGGWYDFGYLLGVMMFFGGGGSGAAAGSRRRPACESDPDPKAEGRGQEG